MDRQLKKLLNHCAETIAGIEKTAQTLGLHPPQLARSVPKPWTVPHTLEFLRHQPETWETIKAQEPRPWERAWLLETHALLNNPKEPIEGAKFLLGKLLAEGLPGWQWRWIKKSAATITQTPWGSSLEQKLQTIRKDWNQSIEQALPTLQKTHAACQHWIHTNSETPTRRMIAIRKQWPDYDPSNPAWQEIHLKEILAAGFRLAQPTKNNGTPSHSIWIVGESHQFEENWNTHTQLLRKAHKAGFTTLTLEEPENLGWSHVLDCQKQAGRWKSDQELREKIRRFLGTSNPKLETTLGLLLLAHSLQMQRIFVDVPKEIKPLALQRQILRITQGEPLDPNRPITALGGVAAAAETILDSYRACKARSLHMAKKIAAAGPGTLHFGGKLHTFDIQDHIATLTGLRPRGIQISYKGEKSPIADALKKTDHSLSKNTEKLEASPQLPDPEIG